MNLNLKWPLGPDIIEECKEIDALPTVDPAHWKPLFEPADFNNEHGPLVLENYRLSQDDMLSWAERVIKLRADIVERAKLHSDLEPQVESDLDNR